jgi:hypothetical protein
MPDITSATTTESSTVPTTTNSDKAAIGDNNFNNLSIGDLTGTGYSLPISIGTISQSINVPSTGNQLIWGTGGDVYNGGQAGSVTLGSNDNSALTLIGNGGIKLEAGLDIKYTDIHQGFPGVFLNSSYHLVEVTNSGTTELLLPFASGNPGQQFIISKGYVGGTLTIKTEIADKIDGEDTIELTILNQRVSLVSSGGNRWLIV